MLASEQRRRANQRDLPPGHCHDERGAERDLGLAEADVATDQPVHRLAGLEVLEHVGDRALLVVGLLIGEAVDEGRVARVRLSDDARSGGALRGDIAYGQGLASTDYQNFFNNVLSNNRQATGQYQDYFTNLFNANNMAQGNYTNYWNRLAGLSGIGQQTNASNATLAASTAQSIGTSANGIANSQLLGGQATGAGYVGAANSVSSALNNAAYYADRSSYANPSSSGGSLGYTPSASTNNFDPNAAYGAGAGSAGFGGGYGV